jgi:AcrR family transcriptional regulator
MTSALTVAPLPDRAEITPARRRLFEAALDLFSRSGYHGVSVRDIVRELDLAPTAIYAHVSSKQELLFELVRIGHEELRDQVRAALLEAGSDPVDQLRAVISANVRVHLTYPELARVLHNDHDALSAEQKAVIEVLRTDLGSLLRDVVRRGIDQGLLDPPDLQIGLAAIVTMGARVVDWWTPESGIAVEHVATTHADLAVRILTR